LVAVAVIWPVPAVVGVTPNATVAIEPACRTGIRQLADDPVGVVQVLPAPVAEELVKVAAVFAVNVPFTVILVARSGPILETVKVAVIGFPAPITPVDGESTGKMQVMHNSLAGRSSTAKASVVPERAGWSGLTVSNVPVAEVVCPAI